MNQLALKDIHLPDTGLWWPLAPGWWMLLILIVLIIYFLPRLLRWLRWKPIKSVSLGELTRIRVGITNGLDEQRALREISILLRRTVISYCGRAFGASITGKNWVEQLRQISGRECFTADQNEWLRIGQYQPSSRCDLPAMLHSCEKWIRSLPRRTPDVAA